MAVKEEGMKHIIFHFADSTSMHGLGRINSARSLKTRVLWSFVCLCSMGMFCFMLSRIVRNYLQFNVVVNVQEVPVLILIIGVTYSNYGVVPIRSHLF